MVWQFPLAQPPGARSCRDGGTWDHASRSHLERPYLIEELHAFREELYLSDSDWEDLLAEVSSLLRKAEKGRLNFDSFGKKGVVCQCESRPSVLEIRMTTTLNFDGLVRLSRLYFSEPRTSQTAWPFRVEGARSTHLPGQRASQSMV